jgi:transposase
VGIDWEWLSMDGAMSKAPLGGKKNDLTPTDRGKSGVKRSVLVEGHGVAIAVSLEGANRTDMKLLEPTLVALLPPRPGAEAPQGICLDKGYDYQAVRDCLATFGFTPHIRSRGEEVNAIAELPGYHARRWVVERLHRWMHRFRRLLIRWKKKAANYLGFVHFACALIALRAAGLFG